MNYALIGCGRIATNHIKAAVNNKLNIVAVCDILPEKAAKLKEDFPIIENIIAEHPMALKDPAPFVKLSKHGDSSLEYTVRIWCENANYWSVYFDVMESVKTAFDANNIEIPFPQMDVHVKNN